MLNSTQVDVCLNRSGHYKGTITGTDAAPKHNGNTSSTFTIPAGALVSLQGDQDFYFSTNDTAATAASSEMVLANVRRIFFLWPTETQIAVRRVAVGTVNVKVFIHEPK